MALTRTYRGQHPDTGQPLWHHHSDDPEKVVLITGPASGDLTLENGETYNVSGDVIEVEPDHVDELMHLIGLQHEQTGHLESHTCGHCTEVSE